MVQGLANKQIAARMDTSESKVKQTMQRLFAKCGVRTRAQLVKVALENYGDLVSEAAPKTSPVRIFHRRDWETVRTV
jgi:two-component system nitrate/nitrite response regulator NarL